MAADQYRAAAASINHATALDDVLVRVDVDAGTDDEGEAQGDRAVSYVREIYLWLIARLLGSIHCCRRRSINSEDHFHGDIGHHVGHIIGVVAEVLDSVGGHLYVSARPHRRRQAANRGSLCIQTASAVKCNNAAVGHTATLEKGKSRR
jgi:hypothetical protein